MNISITPIKVLMPILGILFILFTACQGQPDQSILDEVDAIIDTDPDSAKKLLDEIRENSIGNKEGKFRYELLCELAKFKTGDNLESDSIVRPTYEYYAKNERPSRERMLSNFLMANYYIGKSDLFIGDSLLKNTLSDALRIGNGDYAAIAMISLGNIRCEYGESERALECYQKGVWYLDSLQGQTRYAILGRLSMAKLYESEGKPKAGTAQLDTAITMAREKRDTLLSQLLEERGILQTYEGLYKDAIKNFKEADSLRAVTDFKTLCYWAISEYKIEENDGSIVLSKVRNASPSSNFDKICQATVELNIAYDRNDVENIGMYSSIIDSLQNALDAVGKSGHDESRLKKTTNINANQEEDILCNPGFYVCELLIIVCIVVVIAIIRKKKEETVEVSELTEVDSRDERWLYKKYDRYDSGKSDSFSQDNIQLRNEQIQTLLKDMIEDVNIARDNFAKSIIKDFDFDDASLFVLLGRICGLKNKTIAKILGQSENNISSNFARIRKRIMVSESPNKDFYRTCISSIMTDKRCKK